MQKYQQTQPPLKTYLVKLGIATNGLDGSRDNFELKLVEASDPTAATECIWLSEGFDTENVDDQGDWCTWHGKRAFQISTNACDVDAGCVYWIAEITELPPEDTVVLGKYLPVERANPAAA